MFFYASDGMNYPVADILRYKEKIGRETELEVDMRCGKKLTVGDNHYKSVTLANATTVPADPGTLFVGISRSEAFKGVYFRPVLAWVITIVGQPFPVTAEGLDDGAANDYAIRHPSGVIDYPSGGSFINITDFLKDRGFDKFEIEIALKIEGEAVNKLAGGSPT